jgi:hypothetical protein
VKHTALSLRVIAAVQVRAPFLVLGKNDFPLGPTCFLSLPLENVRNEFAVFSSEPYTKEASRKLVTAII